MVNIVRNRLRDRPIDAKVEDIMELLNREHSPAITEIRKRFNELLDALNPGDVVPGAAAGPTAFLEVVIDSVEYAIPLYPRAP